LNFNVEVGDLVLKKKSVLGVFFACIPGGQYKPARPPADLVLCLGNSNRLFEVLFGPGSHYWPQIHRGARGFISPSWDSMRKHAKHRDFWIFHETPNLDV